MGRVKVFFCLDSDILCSIIRWVFLISGAIQVIGGLSAFGECEAVNQVIAVGGFSGALEHLLCKRSHLAIKEDLSKYGPVIIGFFHLAMCGILFVAICQRARLMFLVYLIVQIVSILVEIIFPFIALKDYIKALGMEFIFKTFYAFFIMVFISVGIQCVFLYIVFFHMSAVSPAPRQSARPTPRPSKPSSRTNTAQPSKRPSKQNVSRTTMKQGSQPNSTEV